MASSPLELLLAWKKHLQGWSADGSLKAAAQQALGLEQEPSQLQALTSHWAEGDFSALPPIRLLPGSTMPAAAGAYGRSTATIYLNADWLQQASEEQGIAVLTEELGHHLDGVLNSEETPGDEGEHFSLLLRQVALTPERLEALRAEDDHTTIRVDGAWVAVEQATIIGTGGTLTGTADPVDTYQVNSGFNTVTALLGPDVLVVAAEATADVTLAATWIATSASKNNGTTRLFATGKSVDLTLATGANGWTVTNSASATSVRLTGSSKNDILISGTARDTLNGGAGKDTFVVSGGATGARIGDLGGADVLKVFNGATVIATLASSWTATSESSNAGTANLFANGFSVNLAGVNTLGSPLVSNGWFVSNAGFVTGVRLTGSTKNDTLISGNGNDTLIGGAGVDTFQVKGGTATITDLGAAAGEADVLVVSAGATANASLAGNWNATAASRNDGTANLTAKGFSVNLAAVTGATGWKVTNANNNTAVTLIGSKNGDALAGGNGNDTINAGRGQNVVDGGKGTDLLIVDYSSIANSAGIVSSISNPADLNSLNGYIYNFSNSSSVFDQVGYSNIERFQISGTSVNDQITTGAGNDTILGGNGGDVINAGDGANSIDGGNSNDTIVTGAGNDTILGGFGDDFIDAGGGINSINGGDGIDTLANADFSTASEKLTITRFSNSIKFTNGTWSVNNIEVFVNLNTGKFADTITLSGRANDSIKTNGGNDTINPGLGVDDVDGGAGDDLLILDFSVDPGPTGAALDGAAVLVQNQTLDGYEGVTDNYSFGAPERMTFKGIERFQIKGTNFSGDGFGGDLINDYLITGLGNDTITALAGRDYIDAGGGDNSIDGGDGNDTIVTGAGNDTILGGLGDDFIDAGGGFNSIDGGGGIDTLANADFSTATEKLTISGGSNLIKLKTGTKTGTWTVNNIGAFVNLNTGKFADTISLSGRANDSIKTNGGNDTINPGLGVDSVDGGADDDLLILDYSVDPGPLNAAYDGSAVVVESQTLDGYEGYGGNWSFGDDPEIMRFKAIERFQITGSNFKGNKRGNGNDIYQDYFVTGIGNDTITSLDGTDYINAGDGDNSIDGGNGNDTLVAGSGNDTITGGAGNDQIDAGGGNDVLTGINQSNPNPGQNEVDTLTGGEGSDRFVLGDSTWIGYDDGLTNSAGNKDYALISDFNIAQDLIQLRGSSSDYLLKLSGLDTNVFINKPGAEPDELIAKIQNTSGLSLTGSYFSYVSPPGIPVVSLSVSSPASVLENGGGKLLYTFSRTGPTTSDLTVTYGITGTALGTDYTGAAPGANQTIKILAGFSTAVLEITPKPDADVEADETVALKLATSPTNYTLGTPGDVIGTITNDDVALPVVSLSVSSPASVLENGGGKLLYTFSRTGPTTSDLTVTYGITGTALGTDYTGAAPGANQTIKILAGFSTAVLEITPKPDADVESNETVALKLATSPTNYTLGTPGDVIGTITNDDVALPVVSLSVSSPASVLENGGGKLLYTFSRTGPTTSDLTVTYGITGTALGTDYTGAAPGANQTIKILAGFSTAVLEITPKPDADVESNETVALKLATSPTNYTLGTPGDVIGTITNDDVALPVVTLSVSSPASVLENGPTNLVYTFTRTGPTTDPLTVNYTAGGNAIAGGIAINDTVPGSDYTGIEKGIGTKFVTFGPGLDKVTVVVDPLPDATVEGDEIVGLLLADGAYTIGTTSVVNGTITNDDTPPTSTITAKVDPNAIFKDINTNSSVLAAVLATYKPDSAFTSAEFKFTSLATPADSYLLKIMGSGLPAQISQFDLIFGSIPGSITSFEVSKSSDPSNALVKWQGTESVALKSLVVAASSGSDKILPIFLKGKDTLDASYNKVDIAGIPELENLVLNGPAVEGIGNNLANSIVGNNLDNRLSGGGGNDTLTGGLGKDTFVFNPPFGSSNLDLITDFNLAQQDKIEFSNSVLPDRTPGPLAESAFFSGASLTKSISNSFIWYKSDTGTLLYDSDGTSGAAGPIAFATLPLIPGQVLTHTSFTII